MDAEPPPYHRRVVRNNERVDRKNVGTMHVPGVFFLETVFAPAGTGAQEGNLENAKQYRNCQFFTPETERTTHFFWNYLHNTDIDDPNIALSLRDSMIEGFMEDKVIIEDQQLLLDMDPDFKMHGIQADAALAHFRRTLDLMIARESEAELP